MFRFVMPDSMMPAEERRDHLIKQMDEFLNLDALKCVMQLLHTDFENLKTDYDLRTRGAGKVVEAQVLDPVKEIEKVRSELYPLFDELGFFHINKPRSDRYSRVLVLGGTHSSCFTRTECGACFRDSSTLSVDGLSCYRPINPRERKSSRFRSSADTEFGVLSDAFADTFELKREVFEEDFISDRNLNSISNIRKYVDENDGSIYRIYAAPSREPELRRADTGDTLKFYYDNAGVSSGESILAVTNNIYCNRQLLQLAHFIIEEGIDVDLDVIGCDPDEIVATPQSYTIILYIQEIIGILDWINRFKKA